MRCRTAGKATGGGGGGAKGAAGPTAKIAGGAGTCDGAAKRAYDDGSATMGTSEDDGSARDALLVISGYDSRSGLSYF